MSLRTRQVARGLNKVIGDALRAGFLPKFETITYKLSRYFSGRMLGTPSMRLRLWPKHGVSSSADYNSTMSEIRQDLEDLYSEGHEISKRLVTGFHYQDVERENLRHRIMRLAADIDRLMLVARDPTSYFDYFHDVFTDFSRVDMSLDGNPPAPVTTAFIDTRLGEVRLDEAQRVERVVLSPDMVSAELPEGSEEMAPIGNAVDQNLNTAWFVRTPWSGKPLEAVVTLTLPKPQIVNTIVVRQHSPKATLIGCEVFSSGSWSVLGEPQSVDFEKVFKSEDKAISSVRVRLRKEEPDDTTGGAWCYLGLRDFSLSRMAYVESGVLVSKPFVVDNGIISRVSLEVSQEVPPETEIEYYVAFPREGYDNVWTALSPISDPEPRHAKVIDLRAALGASVVARQGSANYATQYGAAPVNGVTLYRVITLADTPAPRTVSVHPGPSQLLRTHFINTATDDLDGDAHVPVPQDYVNDIAKTTAPVDFTTGAQFLPFTGGLADATRGGFYRFKGYLQCTSHQSVSYQVTGTGCNVAAYLNGRLVSDYWRFAPGINTIEVLVYKHEGVACTVDIGADLASFMKLCKLYAYRDPMVYLDEHAMLYEVSPRARDYFTVIGKDIIVNFDPLPLAFDVSYEVPRPGRNSVVFKARLSRSSNMPSQTPRLKMYRLRVATIPGGQLEA